MFSLFHLPACVGFYGKYLYLFYVLFSIEYKETIVMRERVERMP